MNLPALSGLLSTSLSRGAGASGELRAALEMEQSILLRELARRTADPQWLNKAELAADRAGRDAGVHTRLYAASRLQRALCALQAAELSGGSTSADAAAWLGEAEQALGCQPGRLNGPGLVRARLGAWAALAAADRDAGLTAAACFDEAIAALEARVRATGAGETQWIAAQCERSDLLIGLGVKLKDIGLLDRAARDLRRLVSAVDPARLPLSWMRAETLHGAALGALGEITGEPRLLKDAAHAFAGAMDAIPSGHSPADRARAAQGLAQTLTALAEASGEPRAHASALAAFDRALGELGQTPSTLRSQVVYHRADCMARRAEASGDERALAEAETAFKAELARAPHKDPVAWAVTQVALARLYEARAERLGDRGEVTDARFALTEALEVFAERGLRSLSEIALTALDRLKARRPRPEAP